MKKFEVPYNFDVNLMQSIKDAGYADYVELIYSAPFFEDHDGAKKFYVHKDSTTTESWRELTREEYETRVRAITEHGFKLGILLQHPTQKVTEEIVSYYIGLGAKSFMVSNDQTALTIRKVDPTVEIIASITKKLSVYELLERDLSMYDKIVLYFPYNRALDTIAMLPKKYKYVLLINCACGYTCPGTHHWFAKADSNGVELSDLNACTSSKRDEMILIMPQDLHYFDEYIDTYKLQGREYTTKMIIDDIERYVERPYWTTSTNQYIEETTVDRREHYNTANQYLLLRETF